SQGVSPAIVPQSRWKPIRAWKGGNETGTGNVGTDSEFVLPNGIDWRDACLRILPASNADSSGVTQPAVYQFIDYFSPTLSCNTGNVSVPVMTGCNDYIGAYPSSVNNAPSGCGSCVSGDFGLDINWPCEQYVPVSVNVSGLPASLDGLNGMYSLDPFDNPSGIPTCSYTLGETVAFFGANRKGG